MIKKIILGIMLLLLMVSVFAYTYDGTTGQVTVPIKKGWNLVPVGITDYGTCLNYLSAIYYYSGFQKSYIGIKVIANQPNPGLNAVSFFPNRAAYDTMVANEFKYPQSLDNPYYGLVGLGSVWMYSSSDCSFISSIMRTSDSALVNSTFLESHKLKAGWNFVNIAPWMIGKGLGGILKNCVITNANFWNSQYQKWEFTTAAAGVAFTQTPGPISESGVGTAFIVKTTNDCVLSNDELISPPALPQ